MGAFWGVDATKLTIHYPSTWTPEKIEDLEQKIADSGMKSVDIDNNVPKFESYTTLPTLSLLDAARLFGL